MLSLPVSEADRQRECIFLDSSDPSMPNKLLQDSSLIKLPFPPGIDPYKLVLDRKQDGTIDRVPTRTPNAFILYRKIFIESAHKEGYYLPMTIISSMASKSWKRESDAVKEEYKRISKKIFEIRNQMFPKSERKKKREKWNFVSFSKKSNSNDSSTKIEMKISTDQLNNEDNQLRESDENSYDPNLYTSELSLNNINEGHLINSDHQIYNQKSENYTDLMHMHDSYDTNMYVDITSQHQQNNNITGTTIPTTLTNYYQTYNY